MLYLHCCTMAAAALWMISFLEILGHCFVPSECFDAKPFKFHWFAKFALKTASALQIQWFAFIWKQNFKGSILHIFVITDTSFLHGGQHSPKCVYILFISRSCYHIDNRSSRDDVFCVCLFVCLFILFRPKKYILCCCLLHADCCNQ